MKISSCFGQYLKAADIDSDTLLTIRDCQLERIEDEDKPVVHFNELDKGLVLNKINASMISEHLGDETDAWIGNQIVLFPSTTPFGGNIVPCIRVRMPRMQKPKDDVPF